MQAGKLVDLTLLKGLDGDHHSEDGTPMSDDDSSDAGVDMFGPQYEADCTAEFEAEYENTFEHQYEVSTGWTYLRIQQYCGTTVGFGICTRKNTELQCTATHECSALVHKGPTSVQGCCYSN